MNLRTEAGEKVNAQNRSSQNPTSPTACYGHATVATDRQVHSETYSSMTTVEQ